MKVKELIAELNKQDPEAEVELFIGDLENKKPSQLYPFILRIVKRPLRFGVIRMLGEGVWIVL